MFSGFLMTQPSFQLELQNIDFIVYPFMHSLRLISECFCKKWTAGKPSSNQKCYFKMNHLKMYFGIFVIFAWILFYLMMNTPVCFYCFILLIRFMYKAICSIFQWRLTGKGRNCIYLEFYYNIRPLKSHNVISAFPLNLIKLTIVCSHIA